jgi:hypothetical protein
MAITEQDIRKIRRAVDALEALQDTGIGESFLDATRTFRRLLGSYLPPQQPGPKREAPSHLQVVGAPGQDDGKSENV